MIQSRGSNLDEIYCPKWVNSGQSSTGDDGIGLESKLLPHIFDLFSQGERSSDRAEGGLGLGLALVKSLVQLNAGSVVAESPGVGLGSTFTVELPQVSASGVMNPLEKPSMMVEAAPKGRTLMVVDDNEDAAEILTMLLETMGYEVLVAHSGTEALRLAQLASPEVLFLDIGLPDIDGYELARRLRQSHETATSALIAVTGYG